MQTAEQLARALLGDLHRWATKVIALHEDHYLTSVLYLTFLLAKEWYILFPFLQANGDRCFNSHLLDSHMEKQLLGFIVKV